ncbi:MAG TPA: hypothetical protein VFY89_07730 [Ktedonobacterales bacterium]
MVSADITTAQPGPPIEPLYIGSGIESLVELEITAWEEGYQAANEPCLRCMDEIYRAAAAACEQALTRYIPLDEERFTDIFTIAWSAGYCTHGRELQRASAPLS